MHNQQFVDIGFPIEGGALPLDHGYLLFQALSQHLPSLRDEPNWGIHPVSGRRVGSSCLQLFQHSLVQLRVPSVELGQVMGLSAKSLCVGRHVLRLGVPSVYPLHPSRFLRSHCVTMAADQPAARFVEALRREFGCLALSQDPEEIEIHVGARKHIHTRARVSVGFEVTLANLEAEASLCLQREGIGGRRYLGLGLFVPTRPGSRAA